MPLNLVASLPCGCEQVPPRRSPPPLKVSRVAAGIHPARQPQPRLAAPGSLAPLASYLASPGRTSAGPSASQGQQPEPAGVTHSAPATRLGSRQACGLLASAQGVVEVDGPLLMMSSSHQDGVTLGHLPAASSLLDKE